MASEGFQCDSFQDDAFQNICGASQYVSSLSLINVPSVGYQNLGTEELDAIFVGKAKRS